MPETEEVTLGTFADDTGYLSSSANPVLAASRLQVALDKRGDWLGR